MQAPVKRKKPGRPPKIIVKKIIPKEGIVLRPTNKYYEASAPLLVNVLELVYDNPIMFKKIFHLFKVMRVSSVRMRFDANEIKMLAVDHCEKSNILVRISGAAMNRYYCEEAIEIGCKPTQINKKFATLSREHGRIVISTNRRHKRSRITMVFSHDVMQEDSVDNIEVYEVEECDWKIESALKKENSYPIHFDLPSKYFKKKVSDFETQCEILRIEKIGSENLRFCYTYDDKKGRHDSYYKNPGLINLVSSLEEDEVFSTSVYLGHIKNISSALVTENIHIAADTTNDLIFTMYLDQEEREIPNSNKKYKVHGSEKCVIKIVTDIIKNKRKEAD
jgi:hypothetical protein